MEFENHPIKCRKFWEAEAVIKRTEVKIREAKGIREKQYYAQDILLEAEGLLSCSNYNDKNPNCLNCHLILLRYIQEYKHLAGDVNQDKMCAVRSFASNKELRTKGEIPDYVVEEGKEESHMPEVYMPQLQC